MTPYYQDELVTLYHGDCRVLTSWASCDAYVTDPPYGIAWSRSANKQRASKAHEGIANDHDTTARDSALALVADKPGLVFGSFYAPFPVGVKQVLVWKKPNDSGVVGSVTGFRRDCEPVFMVGPWPKKAILHSSLLRNSSGMAAIVTATGHPHTKPFDLMKQLIDVCPDGLIADPFCGSGSTLCAAKYRGRRAIGVELDERYCEVAATRLSQGSLAAMFDEVSA